jgi:hypothetical protein
MAITWVLPECQKQSSWNSIRVSSEAIRTVNSSVTSTGSTAALNSLPTYAVRPLSVSYTVLRETGKQAVPSWHIYWQISLCIVHCTERDREAGGPVLAHILTDLSLYRALYWERQGSRRSRLGTYTDISLSLSVVHCTERDREAGGLVLAPFLLLQFPLCSGLWARSSLYLFSILSIFPFQFLFSFLCSLSLPMPEWTTSLCEVPLNIFTKP